MNSSSIDAPQGRAFAKSTILSLIATDPSATRALEAVQALFTYADTHLGQLHGCGNVNQIICSEFELAAVQAHVRGLTEHDQTELARRLLSPRIPNECPFTVNGKCLIFDARPLICRATDYASKTLIDAMWAGIQEGIAQLGVEAVAIDLVAEMRTWLVERVMLGEVSYEEYTEPTGNTLGSPEIERHYQIRYEVPNFEASLKVLTTGTHAEILRFGVPRGYRSEADIDEWFAYAERTIDRWQDIEIDPAEALKALSLPLNLEIPYAGRDAKGILTKFGDFFLERVILPLFPDLCEPIEKRNSGKIRVGYLSNTLCSNNGSYWALDWLRGHTDEFETYALNVGTGIDDYTAKWQEEADHYYQLFGPVAKEARFIKSLELDALIYTDIAADGRTNQLGCMRLAPVQCNAWGHPTTSGFLNQDYHLSSELMEPPNGHEHYREKLIRLPNSGLVFHKFPIPKPGNIREQAGLGKGFLPFMNQNIMKAVPRWDYLFKQINDITRAPIVFMKKGYETEVFAERIHKKGIKAIWIPRLTQEAFLRLMQSADVILDTVEWSGGNTTVQALAAGAPVVTLPGKFMRGRHSLAFHKMAGADGLIASSPEEYVKLACTPDRARHAMSNVQADRLFNDPEPCIGLNEFLRKACRG
jgi:Fe-S-cluster containining protein